jgi:bifunctional non-homologous end joining protein LigD
VYGVCSREHEPKHDGWRLITIIPGDGPVKLLSRQGLDHTRSFCAPFRELAANWRPMVLDGEIAVPDHRGVTHIDALSDAIATRPDRLAYFAFDLLHLDGHDLRRCPIEQRKATLRRVIDDVGCERIVYVDHVVGRGKHLFEKVREMGGEGVVSKRLGRPYRGGDSRVTEVEGVRDRPVRNNRVPRAWRRPARSDPRRRRTRRPLVSGGTGAVRLRRQGAMGRA